MVPHAPVPARRTAALVVVALAAGAVGCGTDPGNGHAGRSDAGSSAEKPAVRTTYPVRLLGDGSTSDTGPQLHQPVPYRLVTGEMPPQFVVFSFDGAAEDGRKLFSRFRAAGERAHAAMTYFLSGTSLLPADRARRYAPPAGDHPTDGPGAPDPPTIADTLRELRLAWREGSEIGTAFNARSCSRSAGEGEDEWTQGRWSSEIRQAEGFVTHWKTYAGLTDEDPLPFDYAKELAGGRAPCPDGGPGLVPAEAAAGFRYDASGADGRQVWPGKEGSVWEFPLPSVPLPGSTREVAATDDAVANDAAMGDAAASGPAAGLGALSARQVHDSLVAAFARSYRGNRAPLYVAAHFATAGTGYLQGVEDTIEDVCARPGVRCVSFKQLADWLDAQDPRVLARLRTLAVGQAPKEGWKDFVAEAKGRS
ncbi:hypothetical protein K7862_27675 [Streptomyces sp. PLK6-54]|uniref:Polysaccharide deacetylase n=1 Tax=Actinacidiphila acidipaludis TaxID=2873382 RepID=A0ABS7QFB2_9ACTN|nr:hypothetical protein [Streptomyces acidipaludis]